MNDFTAAIDLHRDGQLAEAVALYRQVLDAEPNQPDAMALPRRGAHQLGDSRAAAENIRRAIELNPRAAAYHNSLGLALRATGELDAAIASYRRALEISPDFPDALNNLGVALRERGELEEAIGCYCRVLELRPELARHAR